MSNNNKKPIYTYMDKPPKDINPNGLAPHEQKDVDLLFSEPQHILLTTFTYAGHNGVEKVIVGAVYNIVQGMLPRRLPALLSPPIPPAYEICDIPGKGKGVVATRDIALGEVVIVERPVLIFPSVTDLRCMVQLEVYAENIMDPEDWKEYSDLSNVKGNSISKFRGVIGTNAFEVRLVRGKEGYGGVFLELSRLNHSCGPNLTRSWNPHNFALSVQAMRPIRAGQELTIAYEDPCSQSHADRRYDLERKYKFKCACGYCTNTSSTSDQERFLNQGNVISASLGRLYGDLVTANLPRYVGRQKTEMVLDLLIKSLVVVMKEGIECAAALWHYVFLMRVAGLLGDKKKFKEWGFKAVLLSMHYTERERENACRDVERWISWIREPEKKFPDWGLYRF